MQSKDGLNERLATEHPPDKLRRRSYLVKFASSVMQLPYFKLLPFIEKQEQKANGALMQSKLIE
jgi:hypothetical protein